MSYTVSSDDVFRLFLSTQAFIVPLLIVQNLQLVRFQHDAG